MVKKVTRFGEDLERKKKIPTSSWRNKIGFTEFNLKKLSHKFFSFPTYATIFTHLHLKKPIKIISFGKCKVDASPL